MKQGGKVKSWKRRWFVLQYPCLFYFTSSQVSFFSKEGFFFK